MVQNTLHPDELRNMKAGETFTIGKNGLGHPKAANMCDPIAPYVLCTSCCFHA